MLGQRAERALSLVELMVSVAISLVILAALVALFVNTSRSNREFARANSMIENGRLAIQVLESDVRARRLLGHLCARFDDQTAAAVPDDVPTAIPDPCLAYDPADWDVGYVDNLIGMPVQAYDDATVCAGVITDRLADTDVLVVRHAGDSACRAVRRRTAMPTLPASLYFQSTLCLTDVDRPTCSTRRGGFTLPQRDCATPADKRKFMSSIYYVRDYAVTAGDGIPTLMRSQFDLAGGVLEHQPAVPLIEGVEGFRVELGIDDLSETGAAGRLHGWQIEWADPDTRTTPTNRGDGVPDGAFVRCTTAAPCTVGAAHESHGREALRARRAAARSRRGYTDRRPIRSAPARRWALQRRVPAPRLRDDRAPAEHLRPEDHAVSPQDTSTSARRRAGRRPDHAGADHADAGHGAQSRHDQFPGHDQHAVPRAKRSRRPTSAIEQVISSPFTAAPAAEDDRRRYRQRRRHGLHGANRCAAMRLRIPGVQRRLPSSLGLPPTMTTSRPGTRSGTSTRVSPARTTWAARRCACARACACCSQRPKRTRYARDDTNSAGAFP